MYKVKYRFLDCDTSLTMKVKANSAAQAADIAENKLLSDGIPLDGFEIRSVTKIN